MNPDKVVLYDVLLERHQAGSLTPEGREELTRLREAADALMLRKAHAYALLQRAGVISSLVLKISVRRPP